MLSFFCLLINLLLLLWLSASSLGRHSVSTFGIEEWVWGMLLEIRAHKLVLFIFQVPETRDQALLHKLLILFPGSSELGEVFNTEHLQIAARNNESKLKQTT